MNKRKNTVKLSRDKGHRDALLRNMAQDLILREKIKTTLAKAKALRPFVEPLITRAREDTPHNRRLVGRVLYTKEALDKLFKEVAPRYRERKGGYTRIVKLGARSGDAAEAAVIMLVEEKKEDKKK